VSSTICTARIEERDVAAADRGGFPRCIGVKHEDDAIEVGCDQVAWRSIASSP